MKKICSHVMQTISDTYALLSLTLGGFLNLTLLLTFMNVQLTIRSVASAIMYSAVMNN